VAQSSSSTETRDERGRDVEAVECGKKRLASATSAACSRTMLSCSMRTMAKTRYGRREAFVRRRVGTPGL